MAGGNDNKQSPAPHQRSRELIAGLASRVRNFVTERLEPLFATVMEQFLDTAGSTPGQREQSLFFAAYQSLRQSRQVLDSALLLAVDDNFRELGRPAHQSSSHGTDLALQLVSNDILEEMITLDNMVSRVVSHSGRPMELLTERLSAVVGRPLVAHDNPLVPEFLCEAFSRQISTLKLDFAPKVALYRIFESVMLTDWPVLVGECNEALRELGVLPDLEKRRPAIKKQQAPTGSLPKGVPPLASDEAASRRAGSTPGDPAAEAHRQRGESEALGFRGPGADRRSGDVLADLQRHLREQLEATPAMAEPATAQAADSTGTDADGSTAETPLDADQLAAMFSLWRAERDREQFLAELADRGLEGVLENMLATHHHGAEALCALDRGLLRVIDRTFSRLTELVRQQHEASLLLNLELPAAWLALKDPAFLERQSHPGRRLLNELCRVASTLGGEEGASDPLRSKVDEIVERLNGFDVTLRQLSQLLTDLINVVEKDKRATSLREERVLQEADSRARMAQAHEQVVQILSGRLVGRRWPGFLVTFCERAWARVLFLAHLRQGSHSAQTSHADQGNHADQGTYAGGWRQALALLDRLLVVASARRPMAEAERVELIAAIEDKLAHIGYDAVAARHYLESLGDFLADLGSDAGRDDDVFTEAIVVDLPGQVPLREEIPGNLDAETLAFVDALRRGAWVEFREGGKLLRCRLAGTVKGSSRLIFTNRRGAKVAEEHRHRMAVKLQEDKVIVLDNSHLFDQAYNQVITEVQGELRSQVQRAR